MMPDPAIECSHDLTDYLVEDLQPLLDEAGLVVWYDRDGALERPLRAAAARMGWTVAPGPGARNILAARVEIETQLESDSLLWSNERKWVVYLPGERRDPSWYEDFELIGARSRRRSPNSSQGSTIYRPRKSPPWSTSGPHTASSKTGTASFPTAHGTLTWTG